MVLRAIRVAGGTAKKFLLRPGSDREHKKALYDESSTITDIVCQMSRNDLFSERHDVIRKNSGLRYVLPKRSDVVRSLDLDRAVHFKMSATRPTSTSEALRTDRIRSKNH